MATNIATLEAKVMKLGIEDRARLAEIGWTPQSQRAWPEFWSRLAGHHLARLDAAGILYRIPLPSARQKGQEISIVPPYEGAQVRYTVDGSEPGPGSTLYSRPFELPDKGVLKMRAFRPNGRASRTVQGVDPG